MPAILNPLDANALEAAVRVKEAHGGTVTVITMGPDMAKEALRECLAAGADRAVLLSDRAFCQRRYPRHELRHRERGKAARRF